MKKRINRDEMKVVISIEVNGERYAKACSLAHEEYEIERFFHQSRIAIERLLAKIERGEGFAGYIFHLKDLRDSGKLPIKSEYFGDVSGLEKTIEDCHLVDPLLMQDLEHKPEEKDNK